jgi:hypothetical protein
MRTGRTISDARARDKAAACSAGALAAAVVLVVAAALAPRSARALGEASLLDLRAIDYAGGGASPRPSAMRRLAWEVRKRTSVATRLAPTRVRLSDPAVYDQPILYWAGDRPFPALSEAESIGLRRFVTLGGFVLVDDAAPTSSGFDGSIRRELARALPRSPLRPLPTTHVLFRAFYLLGRPVGRVEGPAQLEAVQLDGRVGVLYSRHDLGGALARDNFGNWELEVAPGGDAQREQATRLAVNAVLYALCLDYKDDQVHAPFIMRRRSSQGSGAVP